MKRGVNIALSIVGSLCLVILFALLLQGKQIDVLNPSGEVASAQLSILIATVFLSSVVVIPVFTCLVYFSIKYRAGNKKAKYTPEWGENRLLEGLWWGIPIFIIGILGVITYQTSHSLDPYKPLAGGKPLEVQVVALRWKWLFIYPEQQVASLNAMPAPVNRPIHFSLTADAPMSAFWIPALGSQIYAMQGMESQLNLKASRIGTFSGYTTNINGEGYAKMKFKAKIISDKDFKAWALKARKALPINQSVYNQLAKPKSETDERTYSLADKNLFLTILHKNMSHGSQPKTDESSDEDHTMNMGHEEHMQ